MTPTTGMQPLTLKDLLVAWESERAHRKTNVCKAGCGTLMLNERMRDEG